MYPIVLFGAALQPDGQPTPLLRRRVAAAVTFGRGLAEAFFLPTGGVPQAGRTEAEVMRSLLCDAGIPPASILPEGGSSDTYESVIACSAMLRARGHVGPVAVVTSDFHLMRCVAMMQCMGWTVVPVPAVPGAQGSLPKRMWWWLREIPATVWDVFLVLLWRLRHGRR